MTTSAVALTDKAIVVDELVDAGQFGIHEIADMRISPDNRKRFNEAALIELGASIKEKGVVQPIVIRPVTPTAEHPEKYEIVAGERRYRGSIIAGLKKIPAMLRVLTDLQAAEIRILENLQREDPHEMEEAEGYQQLMMTHGFTADQLAVKVKKSRSYIYARLKLCALTTEARTAFLDGVIDASLALLIARIPVPKVQLQALSEITKPPQQFGGGNEAMSYRRAAEHIQKRYMLDLNGAIFVREDAKLLPRAGACAKCPKRTGNQPEVFVGISADVCTDPDCFAEKAGAHHAQVIKLAEKHDIPVHKGNEANRLYSEQYRDNSKFATAGVALHTFKRNAPHTKNAGTVETYVTSADLPPPACYVVDEDGETTAFYERSALQLALEKVGACETVEAHAKRMRELKASEKTGGKAGKEQTKKDAEVAKELAIEKRAAEETAFRVELYKQLRNRMQSGLTVNSLREYAKRAISSYSLPDDLLGDVYTFDTSSDKSLCAYIDEASVGEIQLILIDLMFGECLGVDKWNYRNKKDVRDDEDFQALMAMARHEGIDPKRVEETVAMKQIDMADLDAHQVRQFIEVNPDRINELTKFILESRPLLVNALDIAAKDLGYIYLSLSEGGFVKRDGSDGQTGKETALGDDLPPATPTKTSPATSKPKGPAAKPGTTAVAAPASKVSKPPAKVAAKTSPAKAETPPLPSKKAPIAPAAAWPFQIPGETKAKPEIHPSSPWPWPTGATVAAQTKPASKSSKETA